MPYELGPRARGAYQVLLNRIRSGELAPGTRLPAHTHLATTFGVAPLTMRQVLARLEADRLLVRERGRGTFVRAAAVPHVLIVALDSARRADLEQQVRAGGKRPLVVATPAEALAALERETPPSLAIVDLPLPAARDGLGLVRRLRQRLPDLAIAVLSPTRGQQSRLEHSVAQPLLIVSDPRPGQLSKLLRADMRPTGSGFLAADTKLARRLEQFVERYVGLQLAGERAPARELMLHETTAAGLSVPELYRRVLHPAQYRIGELWQRNEISVAREHLATAITESVMAELAASAPHAPSMGMRVVVACVEGELHDVGARMVADLLELDGFSVRFLGADTPTDSLLAILGEESPRLLVLSAAMPERLVELRTAVARVGQTFGARVCIFVGGQIMQWAGEAVRGLEVGLAAFEALETLAEARQLVIDDEARISRTSSTG